VWIVPRVRSTGGPSTRDGGVSTPAERLQVVIGHPKGTDLCGPHSRAKWRKHAVKEPASLLDCDCRMTRGEFDNSCAQRNISFAMIAPRQCAVLCARGVETGLLGGN
jgi:hypothetical protein